MAPHNIQFKPHIASYMWEYMHKHLLIRRLLLRLKKYCTQYF